MSAQQQETMIGWYLEHREGTHFKFYTVLWTAAGGGLVVKHWGRIGTSGQVKLEVGGRLSEARRTISSKLSKGYQATNDEFEFTVFDSDIQGAIDRNDPRRLVTLFDRALREPKFTHEKDGVIGAYDHLLSKCQALMDRAATQPFESVFNDFEELREVFKDVEDKHELAVETVKMTERMLGEAMIKGSF